MLGVGVGLACPDAGGQRFLRVCSPSTRRFRTFDSCGTPCRPAFMPRQTRFRSYQRCCRGAGGRRKAVVACLSTPARAVSAHSRLGTVPGSKFGSCGTPTMLCFPAHKTQFRSYQKCCGA